MKCARCAKDYPGGDPKIPGAELCGFCLLVGDPLPAAVVRRAVEPLPPRGGRGSVWRAKDRGGARRRVHGPVHA